jgi:sulfate permease, SulP family
VYRYNAPLFFGMARVKQDPVVRLEAFGLAAKIGQDQLLPTLPTGVAAFQQWVAAQDRHPARNRRNS